LSVLEGLEQSGGAYVAAFDKGLAQAVVSKAHNPQYKASLLAKVGRMEKKLSIAQRWHQDSPEFQVGLYV
jgi:glucuronate isomerase